MQLIDFEQKLALRSEENIKHNFKNLEKNAEWQRRDLNKRIWQNKETTVLVDDSVVSEFECWSESGCWSESVNSGVSLVAEVSVSGCFTGIFCDVVPATIL